MLTLVKVISLAHFAPYKIRLQLALCFPEKCVCMSFRVTLAESSKVNHDMVLPKVIFSLG